MRRFVVLSVFAVVCLCGLLFCSGCASYNEAKRNCANIERLRIGMTRAQVKEIMGEPLKEKYCSENVWFYYTQHCWYDGMYTRDECTPLLFDSFGKLEGVGYDAYKRILNADPHRRYMLDEQL